MDNIVVSLYDIKSNCYEGLYCFKNRAVAQRHFDYFKDKIPFYEDKVAYIVGQFDDNKGRMLPFETSDYVSLFEVSDE